MMGCLVALSPSDHHAPTNSGRIMIFCQRRSPELRSKSALQTSDRCLCTPRWWIEYCFAVTGNSHVSPYVSPSHLRPHSFGPMVKAMPAPISSAAATAAAAARAAAAAAEYEDDPERAAAAAASAAHPAGADGSNPDATAITTATEDGLDTVKTEHTHNNSHGAMDEDDNRAGAAHATDANNGSNAAQVAGAGAQGGESAAAVFRQPVSSRPPVMWMLLQPSRVPAVAAVEKPQVEASVPVHIDQSLPDYMMKGEKYDETK